MDTSSWLSWLASNRTRVLLVALPPALLLSAVGADLLFSPGAVTGAPGSPAQPPTRAPAVAQPLAPPASSALLVEVSGAVARPGLYRITKGERVSSVIAAAGGLSASADPARLPNMAARLRDGQQVAVPELGAPGGSQSSQSSRSTRSSLVDLNSATAAELSDVPGVSPELAAEAVRYRSQYGGFSSAQELVTVLGMSQSDYQMARRHLHV